MNELLVGAALVAANFIWQCRDTASDRRWMVALERSFFQAVALATFALVQAIGH